MCIIMWPFRWLHTFVFCFQQVCIEMDSLTCAAPFTLIYFLSHLTGGQGILLGLIAVWKLNPLNDTHYTYISCKSFCFPSRLYEHGHTRRYVHILFAYDSVSRDKGKQITEEKHHTNANGKLV